MRTFTKRRSNTCSLCGKPRLYAGSRRCACGDPIGFLPVAETALGRLHGHFDYMERELSCVAEDPPLTPEACAEYLRGFEAYIKQVRELLPPMAIEEEFAL